MWISIFTLYASDRELYKKNYNNLKLMQAVINGLFINTCSYHKFPGNLLETNEVHKYYFA